MLLVSFLAPLDISPSLQTNQFFIISTGKKYLGEFGCSGEINSQVPARHPKFLELVGLRAEL